jgi:hypothetical protein
VHADSNAQCAVAAVPRHQQRAEANRCRRVGHAQHEPVTQCLDLLPTRLGQKSVSGGAKLGRGVRGELVAVDLGQRGVAGEIREDERLRIGDVTVHRRSPSIVPGRRRARISGPGRSDHGRALGQAQQRLGAQGRSP